MKKLLLKFLILFLFIVEGGFGQELHNQSNAASIQNESNSIAGWSGSADISSDNTNPQLGNFALRMVSNTGNRYRMDYFYNATVGTDYVIRIWARQGPQVTIPAAPAFANWSGVTGFSTTLITDANWTEYVFNVTATSSNPRITIYNGVSSSGNTAGNTVFVDNVSILPAGFDTTPPTAPTGLVASNTTSTGTTLNWTASTDNVAVTGYTVFQGATQIGTTNGTTTTFTVTGLTPSSPYAFTVTANDAVPNTSAPSNTANVTTAAAADTTPPTAPTGLVASNTTSTGTTLNWTASTDNVAVTGYTVFQGATQIGTTNGTTTTFTVTGLTPSSPYAFTVTANDAVPNTSAPSNTANVTTAAAADTTPPTAPTGLVASNTTSTGTTLNWTASTDNVAVTGYTVFQGATQIGTTNGTTTTFTVTGLTPSSPYAFTVTANDAVPNTSAPSNTANVTTAAAADTTPPTAPTGLVASNTTSTGTTLNWTASTDNVAVTGYTVFQGATQIGTTNGTTTTFTVTGLTPSSPYAFTVTANDAVPNTSAPSNTANVTTAAAADTTPPTAPTGLVASNTTSTGTTLNWTASTDNVAVTGYTVFQGATQIGTTNGTTTTFTVTGLTPSSPYAFTVTANDAVPNTSAPSNTANVTTAAAADTTPPTAPTGLVASNTTSTGTTLNWTASTDNVAVTGYTVFQGATQIGTTNGTTTTFTVTGLTPSSPYAFTVTANDAVPNTSAPSNTANVTTAAAADTTPPTAPTGLVASNTTSTGTTLNWTASTDNVAVTGYTVFQGATQIGTTNGTTTTFTVTGLTPSSPYAFTVTANDAVPNTSAPSNTANVTTAAAADTTPPTAPTGLVASNTTSTGTTLNWTASTDNVAVTGYTVFQGATQIGTTNGTTTTFTVTGLTPSSPYAFTVTANDAVPNTSAPSNTANVTTAAAADTTPPTAPTGLVASNTTSTGTTLNWTASTDNVAVTGYTVFQGATQIGTTNGTTTTFTVTGLTPSSPYAFTVTANDAVPNTSAPSNTANVTTAAAADTTPPTAPTGLVASNTTSTGTTLNWTASTDNVAVTGYTVFQGATQIGTTNGTTTTFTVTGLTPSSPYAFTVTANDAVPNTSAPSNTANVTTAAAADTTPPTAPTGLVASNTTSTGTTLNWTASTDNVAVTGYTVFQGATQIGTTNGTTTTFTVTGLTPSSPYAFTVTANDAVPNTSAPSNTANVTTAAAADTTPPTAPTGLVASNTTSTGTTLNWTASTDNVAVTGYTVFQGATQIGTTDGATTFNVTGLTPSTAYAFTVTARDTANNVSPASAAVNVTTSQEILHYTEQNANLNTVDWRARDLTANQNIFVTNGNIGIGTTNTFGYRLAIDGNMVAEEIKVELSQNWPDFVFNKNYGLPTLEEVEKHIAEKGHLPNIPSAKEVEDFGGINLGQMNAKLLQKIEELTLYTIQQEKKIIKLEVENQKIQLLSQRLMVLEKLIKDNN